LHKQVKKFETIFYVARGTPTNPVFHASNIDPAIVQFARGGALRLPPFSVAAARIQSLPL